MAKYGEKVVVDGDKLDIVLWKLLNHVKGTKDYDFVDECLWEILEIVGMDMYYNRDYTVKTYEEVFGDE